MLINIIITATDTIKEMESFIRYEYHRCGNMHKVKHLHTEIRAVLMEAGFKDIKEVRISNKIVFKVEESLDSSILNIANQQKETILAQYIQPVTHFVDNKKRAHFLPKDGKLSASEFMLEHSNAQDTWLSVEAFN